MPTVSEFYYEGLDECAEEDLAVMSQNQRDVYALTRSILACCASGLQPVIDQPVVVPTCNPEKPNETVELYVPAKFGLADEPETVLEFIYDTAQECSNPYRFAIEGKPRSPSTLRSKVFHAYLLASALGDFQNFLGVRKYWTRFVSGWTYARILRALGIPDPKYFLDPNIVHGKGKRSKEEVLGEMSYWSHLFSGSERVEYKMMLKVFPMMARKRLGEIGKDTYERALKTISNSWVVKSPRILIAYDESPYGTFMGALHIALEAKVSGFGPDLPALPEGHSVETIGLPRELWHLYT